MSAFDDFEPEDEYDASDPLHVRLRIITKIADTLASSDETTRARRRTLIARLLRRIVDELEHDDG